MTDIDKEADARERRRWTRFWGFMAIIIFMISIGVVANATTITMQGGGITEMDRFLKHWQVQKIYPDSPLVGDPNATLVIDTGLTLEPGMLYISDETWVLSGLAFEPHMLTYFLMELETNSDGEIFDWGLKIQLGDPNQYDFFALHEWAWGHKAAGEYEWYDLNCAGTGEWDLFNCERTMTFKSEGEASVMTVSTVPLPAGPLLLLTGFFGLWLWRADYFAF